LSSTKSCVRLEGDLEGDREEEGKCETLFAAEIFGGRGTPLKMMEFHARQTPQMTKRGSDFRCF